MIEEERIIHTASVVLCGFTVIDLCSEHTLIKGYSLPPVQMNSQKLIL